MPGGKSTRSCHGTRLTRQWNPGAQRVYAAPLDIPQAPEGMDDLSPAEIMQTIEPTDVNHVWVISRLSGSEGVISLRSASCVTVFSNSSRSR